MASDDEDMCFMSCEAAGQIAERTGKRPALCDEDGDFRLAFEACSHCVDANRNSTQDLSDVAGTELRDYLEWCDVAFMTQTLTFFASGSTVTDVFLVEATGTITAGTPTVSADTNSDDDESSKAWIAGPVVGSIVGMALLLGLAFMLGRRWRRNKEKVDEEENGANDTAAMNEPADESHGKAQLHADELPKPVFPIPELHPDSIHEVEGSSPADLRVEKPANEAPARELPGDEVEDKEEPR